MTLVEPEKHPKLKEVADLIRSGDYTLVVQPYMRGKPAQTIEAWQKLVAEAGDDPTMVSRNKAAELGIDIEYLIYSDTPFDTRMNDILPPKPRVVLEDDEGKKIYRAKMEWTLQKTFHERFLDNDPVPYTLGFAEDNDYTHYPIIWDRDKNDYALSIVQVNGKDALVVSSANGKPEDLHRRLKDVGLVPKDVWGPNAVVSNYHGSWVAVVENIPDELFDAICRTHDIPEIEAELASPRLVADLKNLPLPANAKGEVDIDSPIKMVASAAVARKAPEKPDYTLIPEDALRAKLKGLGVSVVGLKDIDGMVAGCKIVFPKASKKSEIYDALCSLMHHTINNGKVDKSDIQPSNGGFVYYPGVSTRNMTHRIAKACGTHADLDLYEHPMERIFERAKSAYKGKVEFGTEGLASGILRISNLPVLYQYDANPHTKKGVQRVGEVTVHVMPVKTKRKQIAIAVNAKIVSEVQLGPILELLQMNRNALNKEFKYDEATGQTLITLDIKDDKVFQGLQNSFGVPNHSPATKTFLLKYAAKHVGAWNKDKPETEGFEPRRMSFVSEMGQPAPQIQTLRTTNPRGARERRGGNKGGAIIVGSSKPVSSQELSENSKTDDFGMTELKQFVNTQLDDYQACLMSAPEPTGEMKHYLYLALTHEEYGTLREKITHAGQLNTNKSDLDTQTIKPLAPITWDERYIDVVRIELPEHVHEELSHVRKISKLAPIENDQNGANKAFAEHFNPHIQSLTAESKLQQDESVDAVEVFARAMVRGHAAVGYVHYGSPNELKGVIDFFEDWQKLLEKYKDNTSVTFASRLEEFAPKLKNFSPSLVKQADEMHDRIERMSGTPADVLARYAIFINEMKKEYTMLCRYAESPDTPVKLPIIMAYADPIVKGRDREGDKKKDEAKRSKDKGVFHILRDSVGEGEGMNKLRENWIPEIGTAWNTKDGYRILQAKEQASIRSGKKDSKKGKPTASFIVSPALAAAAELRAMEMIFGGEEIVEEGRRDIQRWEKPVPLSNVPIKEAFFPAEKAEEVAYVAQPERNLGYFKHRAALVYEKQDHGLSTRVDAAQRGRQAVIYLAADNAGEVATLVRELSDAGLLAGQKKYQAVESKVLKDALARYNEECLPLFEFLHSDGRIALKKMIDTNPDALINLIKDFDIRQNPLDFPDDSFDARRLMKERIADPLYRNEISRKVVDGIRQEIEKAEREYAEKLAKIHEDMPGLAEALEESGFTSIADVKDLPVAQSLDVSRTAEQVELVKPDGSVKLAWQSERGAFKAALAKEFVPNQSKQFVKIYLKPEAETYKPIMDWRSSLHGIFNDRAGELRVKDVLAPAEPRGAHFQPRNMKEGIKVSRANNTASRMAKMESPDDAARKMAGMTAGPGGHTPAYMEGIWAAMHSPADDPALAAILEARQAQPERQ